MQTVRGGKFVGSGEGHFFAREVKFAVKQGGLVQSHRHKIHGNLARAVFRFRHVQPHRLSWITQFTGNVAKDIFHRRSVIGKDFDFVVETLPVKGSNDAVLQHVVDPLDVHHHPVQRINWTFNGKPKDVVVAMTKGRRPFAEPGPVLFGSQVGKPIPMAAGKRHLSGHPNQSTHHDSLRKG